MASGKVYQTVRIGNRHFQEATIFPDSGRKIFIIRGLWDEGDSYLQVVVNGNDKTITFAKKEGSGSETALFTIQGS